MSKSTYISLLLAGVALGCGDEMTSEKSIAPVSRLLSFEKVNTISLQDLTTFAGLAGQQSVVPMVRHGVDTYRLVYKTTLGDVSVNASGIVYIPRDLQVPAPLISLQHGTTFLKDRAPSVGDAFTGMEYFAAAGYIALMPDYIGYGASADVFHPYYDETSSANTVIDFIKAAQEFLQNERIAFNDKLFLAGYSEGGFVTLAAARELDVNSAHKLSVTAAAAGAGGYNLEHMLANVTSGRQYSYPAYLAFVLIAYNETYGWNRPLTDFFSEQYATALETYLNGKYDGWQINSRLTNDVTRLLNPKFLSDLNNEGGEAELKAALARNSVTGWSTQIPIRLFHGTRDEIIPASNSETTLSEFHDAGSTDVSLTLIPGGTHGSSFLPMIRQFVPWLESFR